MIIKKSGSFCACHRILEHEGKCKNIHGHTYFYKISLFFETEKIEKIGYLIDFSDLKQFKKLIDDKFDHACIFNPEDKILKTASEGLKQYEMPKLQGDFTNPSTENIARCIFQEIDDYITRTKMPLSIKEIELCESKNNCVIINEK